MRDQIKKIVAIVLIYTVCGVFFIQSLSMAKDAGLFPRLISVVLAFLNTLYTIQVLRGKDVSKKKRDETIPKKLYGIILLSAAYVILVQALGYVISTTLYLPIAMKFLGVSNKKVLVLVTVLSVGLIFLCFGALLDVPMPTGIFGI